MLDFVRSLFGENLEQGQIRQLRCRPRGSNPFRDADELHAVEILAIQGGWVKYRFISSTITFQNESMRKGVFRYCYPRIVSKLSQIQGSVCGKLGGLYHKYNITKDGVPVGERCFVLKPESDPDALEALRTYAHITRNTTLKCDLITWIDKIDVECALKNIEEAKFHRVYLSLALQPTESTISSRDE